MCNKCVFIVPLHQAFFVDYHVYPVCDSLCFHTQTQQSMWLKTDDLNHALWGIIIAKPLLISPLVVKPHLAHLFSHADMYFPSV